MFAFMRNRGPVEYVVPRRELAAADHNAAECLNALDILLAAWAGRAVKRWEHIDALLDERLFHRPADVMATGGEDQ